MAEKYKTTTVSKLPEPSTLEGFYAFGTDQNNNSVKVPIEQLKGNKGDKADPPVVGANGNWWIDGVDSGQPSRGQDGTNIAYKVAFNVSQYNNVFNYADAATARNAVPSTLRGLGQIVTYKLATGKWVTESYQGTDLTGWATAANWKGIGGVDNPVYSTTTVDQVTVDYSDYITTGSYGLNLNGAIVAGSAGQVCNIINKVPVVKGQAIINATIILDKLTDAWYPAIHVYNAAGVRTVRYVRTTVFPFTVDIPEDGFLSMYIDATTAATVQDYKLENVVINQDAYTINYTNGDVSLNVTEVNRFIKDAQSNLITTDKFQLETLSYTDYANQYPNGNAGTGSTTRAWQLEANTDYILDLGKAAINSLGFIEGVLFTNTAAVNTSTYATLNIAGTRYVSFRTNDSSSNYFRCNIINVASGTGDNIAPAYSFTSAKLQKNLSGKKYISDTNIIPPRINRSNERESFVPTMDKIYINFLYNLSRVASTDYDGGMHPIEITDSNGNYWLKYCELGWQGRTTLVYRKKNLKIKIYNEDGTDFKLKIGDRIPRKTFHLKADFIDITKGKNSGGALIVKKWYESRPFNKRYPYSVYPASVNRLDFKTRTFTGARCVIGVIPCVVSVFGAFWGIYSFNDNAFAENFNAYKDTDRVYKGSSYFTTSTSTKSNWEELVEDAEGDAMSDEAFQPMLDFSNWLQSVASDSVAYKAGLDNWIDVDSMLEYYCLLWFGDFFDNITGNLMMPYMNGKMHLCWYDMDRCFGDVTTTTPRPYNANPFVSTSPTDNLWKNFHTAYETEIAAKYKELRDKGVISIKTVEDTVIKFSHAYSDEELRRDTAYYWTASPSSPSNSSTALITDSYIMDWVTKRLEFLDNKFEYTT